MGSTKRFSWDKASSTLWATCMPYVITMLRNTMAAKARIKRDNKACNKERERDIRTIT